MRRLDHSIDEVAGKVVKYIRELKPDIVLTFDPIGGYKHPDHIHIQRATTLAFEKADDASFYPEAGSPFKPRALYYHVFPSWFLKWATKLMPLLGKDPRKWGRNKDIDLTDLIADFPIHVKLNIRARGGCKKERECATCFTGRRYYEPLELIWFYELGAWRVRCLHAGLSTGEWRFSKADRSL